MKKNITESFVEVLNRALKVDNHAIQLLFKNRYQCNEGLLNDPMIQVRVGDNEIPTIGTLGLINGLLESIGSEKIYSMIDLGTGEIVNFGNYKDVEKK